MASKLTGQPPVWHDELTIIDPDDPVQGGADGVDNIPHVELMQNDVWLKTELAKALERITALENRGTTTPTGGTGGTTTPVTTTPTGAWSFWYSISTLNNLDTGETTSTTIGKFNAQPIYDYISELRFKSDLPKKVRLPYSEFNQTHPTATADGYSNRVLKYAVARGQQPDYSTLPSTLDYQVNNGTSQVLDYTYFGVSDDGSVWLNYGLGLPNPSAKTQAELKGIIKEGQISPEQYYDVYYVFLLDEKANNLLTNEQIVAQQWGNYHIEKVTMDTRWDVGTGGFTNVQVNSQPMSEGGNIATIEA